MERKHNYESVIVESIDFWGDNALSQGGMRVNWSSDFGFGQLDIYVGLDGVLKADTEYMDSEDDKEFTQAVLSKLLEKLIIVG